MWQDIRLQVAPVPIRQSSCLKRNTIIPLAAAYDDDDDEDDDDDDDCNLILID